MRFFAVLLGYLLCIGNSFAGIAQEAKVFSFGVVPQLPPSKLLRNWGPLLAEIEKRTGITIYFDTAKDISTFEQRLAVGRYDIAYLNPYHYVSFNDYQAIVRSTHSMRGVIVTAKKRQNKSVADLNNQQIAFPSPGAFAASVVMQTELREAGIRFTPIYFDSHEAVYRAVRNGLVQAGSGIERTFDALKDTERNELVVIYKTSKAFPSHPIAVHKRVGPATAKQIQDTLIAIANDPDPKIRALLTQAGVADLVTATDADYNSVRALRLPSLKHQVLGW